MIESPEGSALTSAQTLGNSAQRVEQSFYRRRGKRILDLALGIPLLVLALPIILVCALLTVALSGWAPFYGARRLGRGGRAFTMWKVRTMVRDADKMLLCWRETHPDLAREYDQKFKVKDDPRVTRLGRLLRRTSIDELPQLWNVVSGDMSSWGQGRTMRPS